MFDSMNSKTSKPVNERGVVTIQVVIITSVIVLASALSFVLVVRALSNSSDVVAANAVSERVDFDSAQATTPSINLNPTEAQVTLPAGSYKQISTGASHVCTITVSDTVDCWGDNTFGQLNLDSETSSLEGVKAVSTGYNHTCVITSSDSVQCVGQNNYGEVGTTAANSVVSAIDVSGVSQVEAISAGQNHTCIINSADQVFCWGRNNHRQLGPGSSSAMSSTPIRVTGFAGAQSISAGENHTCVVTSTDEIFCWGRNDFRQVDSNSSNPTIATPIQITELAGAEFVSAGGNHTCAINSTSNVLCWGQNQYGQTSVDPASTVNNYSPPTEIPGLTRITQIATGKFHTCTIAINNRVRCFGRNNENQVDQTTENYFLLSAIIPNLTNIIEINAQENNTCTRNIQGDLKCFGKNADSSLTFSVDFPDDTWLEDY